MQNSNQKIFKMIATGLARRPAYLLLFGLGFIGCTVAAPVAIMGDGYLQIFSMGGFFLFLVVSAFAVVRVERYLIPEGDGPIPDFQARKEFLSGPNGARLSGAWTLIWHWQLGDDADNVTLVVSGATVFGSSYDDENSRSYWLLGRIDDDGNIPMILWGIDGYGPVGTAYLRKAEGNSLSGSWVGDDKNGKESSCKITLERKA